MENRKLREPTNKGHPPKKNKKGLVIVNSGNGKGKSSAAYGMVFRAWGWGMRIAVLHFIKDGKEDCGEYRTMRKLDIPYENYGTGFTWQKKNQPMMIQKAREGWERAKELIRSEQYDLLILDEFTYPLQYDWITSEEVVSWMRDNKPSDLHIIITGRNAPLSLIEYADLVTEMVEIKHPLITQHIPAQIGIEY